MEHTDLPQKHNVTLPVATQTLIQEWRESPKKSYDNLPTLNHKEILSSPSPTLQQINREIGEDQALLIISMAIEDVNLLVREERRMNPPEIIATARRILKRFWYFKAEDLKTCFESHCEKIFSLEGALILEWLASYDVDRDNVCTDIATENKAENSGSDTISHSVYLAMQRVKAENGDKKAARILQDYAKRSKIRTPEQIREEEIKFRIYKHNYIKSKSCKASASSD